MLATREASALKATLALRISHKRVPHKTGAQIFGHQHGDSRIEANHIRVVPLFQGIERIDRSIAAPGLGPVLVPDVFENPQGRLGQKWERTSTGARNHL